jgi:MFS family permease
MKRKKILAKDRASIRSTSKRTFTSWGFQHYRKYALGTFVMNLGTWMNRIAQDWLIIQLTGSGVALGIVTGIQFAPAIFLSFYGGSLGDRHNKKAIMAVCSAMISLSGVILALIVIANLQTVTIVYIFALVVGIFSSIDMPIRHSLMSDLVGEENVSNAVSLNSVNFNLARIIGPASAGFTVSIFGVAAALIASSVGYLLFSIVILNARNTTLRENNEDENEGHINFVQTLKFIWLDKSIVKVLFMVATLAFFGLNFQITTALMAVNIFGLGAAGYGLLSSTTAVGALFGGLISAHRNASIHESRLARTGLMFGFAQIAAGFSPNIAFYSIMLVFSGFFALMTTIAANSLIQQNTPYAIRGKILGIYTVIFSGSMAFGAPAVGYFTDFFGPQETLILGGVAVVVVSVVVILSTLKQRKAS